MLFRFANVYFAALVLLLALGSAQSQQPTPDGTKKPPNELIVAPDAAQNVPMLPTVESNGLADICRELEQYLKSAANQGGKTVPLDQAATPGNMGPSGDGQRSAAEGAKTERPPSVDKVQQDSGVTNPIPNSEGSKAAVPIQGVAQATQVAAASDLRLCQTTVRRMRGEGVALPPGLLALGALKPNLLQPHR